ncbi:MAG TPA: LysE family translocator [Micropepsaceae bacterium]|nr:LysE family translocator [Micropepsaceae bacterium]
MMPFALYLAFLVATTLLLAIPGPNVALIVSTSIAYGRRHGLVTVGGTSSAMALQLGLTIAGLTAVLTISAALFGWLRWAGVIYLCYLAFRALLAPAADPAAKSRVPKSLAATYLRGFLVSLANPKTLLFFGAFLPQFVSPTAPLLPQLLLLASSFLVLAILFDSTWAVLASRLGSVLAAQGRLRHWLEGALLLGAGLGLALARKT